MAQHEIPPHCPVEAVHAAMAQSLQHHHSFKLGAVHIVSCGSRCCHSAQHLMLPQRRLLNSAEQQLSHDVHSHILSIVLSTVQYSTVNKPQSTSQQRQQATRILLLLSSCQYCFSARCVCWAPGARWCLPDEALLRRGQHLSAARHSLLTNIPEGSIPAAAVAAAEESASQVCRHDFIS